MYMIYYRRGYRKKMNLLKISRLPDFIQCFTDFSQRFPDFSLTKLFKVRKCERCGSLNPRLNWTKLNPWLIFLFFFWRMNKLVCFLLFGCLAVTLTTARPSEDVEVSMNFLWKMNDVETCDYFVSHKKRY